MDRLHLPIYRPRLSHMWQLKPKLCLPLCPISRSGAVCAQSMVSWAKVSHSQKPALVSNSFANDLPLQRSQFEFVSWFREAWPYIQGHRGSVFVVVLPGEVLSDMNSLDRMLQDVALMHGLGVKLVLVPGTQLQINDIMRERGNTPQFHGAYRVTDHSALEASMEASGKVRVHIEARLSRAPSIPALRRHGETDKWHNVGISVASGNFVLAKRRGVVDGVDFIHTGEVKKVDVSRIRDRLDGNSIVLMSNLGYSPTGDTLNCNTYEVATACAIALKADKLVCMVDGPIVDEEGQIIRWMTLPQADLLIRQRASQSATARDYVRAAAGNDYIKTLGLNPSPGTTPEEDRGGFAVGGLERLSRTYGHLSELAAAVYSCRAGIQRVHLLDYSVEGSLLLELYTRDGVGTMISSDVYEGTREATAADIAGISVLLKPLEDSGVLVHRSREQLMKEVQHFTVVEQDGAIIACAALFPHFAHQMAEVAAFAVAPAARGQGRGDRLLDYLEKKSLELGIHSLFLLTTRTADWFVQRGFSSCELDALPKERVVVINRSRNSKAFMKIISKYETQDSTVW